MRHLILVMWLAVAQTSAPLPRQTANAPAQKADKVKNNTAGNQEPITQVTPPSVELTQKPERNEKSRDNEASPNAEQTVRIRELPPVSVRRDWADWFLWGASALLALVGILGIGLAYWTLTILKRQTEVAEDAAEAALLNAQAFINSERAWMAGFRTDQKFDVRPPEGQNIAYSCILKNVGQTPSRILEVGLGFSKITSFSQIAPEPVYAERQQFNRMLVVPNDSFTVSVGLIPQLISGEYESIRKEKLFVYGYGFVKYLDMFSRDDKNIRETRFCHCYQVAKTGEPFEGFRPCIEAPDSYHKAT